MWIYIYEKILLLRARERAGFSLVAARLYVMSGARGPGKPKESDVVMIARIRENDFNGLFLCALLLKFRESGSAIIPKNKIHAVQ